MAQCIDSLAHISGLLSTRHLCILSLVFIKSITSGHSRLAVGLFALCRHNRLPMVSVVLCLHDAALFLVCIPFCGNCYCSAVLVCLTRSLVLGSTRACPRRVTRATNGQHEHHAGHHRTVNASFARHIHGSYSLRKLHLPISFIYSSRLLLLLLLSSHPSPSF